MKITKAWLESKDACKEGIDWFVGQKETDGLKLVKKLISEDKLDWASWLIVRFMKYKQYVSYAVFAAEQVIEIYEKEHPGDNRPRKAIEAAKKCIKKNTKDNRAAAYDAAYTAFDVARTYNVFADAARAAQAAAYTAFTAARTDYIADVADVDYADFFADAATVYAADAAASCEDMMIKILNFGIELLEEKND